MFERKGCRAFGPQGSRRHLEKIASGTWTLEDIDAVGDQMAATAGEGENSIGELAEFRDALREKYGMGTAALLDELIYGPSGKQAIRHTLLDMVHAARRADAQPAHIQASARQALGLIQMLNTQLVTLHDQILKPRHERQ